MKPLEALKRIANAPGEGMACNEMRGIAKQALVEAQAVEPTAEPEPAPEPPMTSQFDVSFGQ